jgi:hypothetical protein
MTKIGHFLLNVFIKNNSFFLIFIKFKLNKAKILFHQNYQNNLTKTKRPDKISNALKKIRGYPIAAAFFRDNSILHYARQSPFESAATIVTNRLLTRRLDFWQVVTIHHLIAFYDA